MAAVVAALTIAVVAGCTPMKQERPKTGLEAGGQYVAIGDSYTAAPNVGDPTEDDPWCQRTVANYPHQVAARLEMKLVDASCGAAATENLLSPQKIGEASNPPQIEALTGGTDLVTVSLGGNDGGFFARLASCVVYAGQPGSPCADQLGTRDQQKAQLDATRTQIQQNLVSSLRAITTAAPNARVLVVGYPQFAPETKSCKQFPLAPGDVAFVYELNVLLNKAVQAAAEQVELQYVDLVAATNKHDVCAKDPWVAGATPEGAAAPYHPYIDEQEAAAEAIIDALETDFTG